MDIIHIPFPGLSRLSRGVSQKTSHTYFDAALLGFIFALAFCPYSGVLYFGILVPMTIQSSAGMLLLVVFAIATGIPVIIFAWLLANTLSGKARLYGGIKVFEIWFRRAVALLFTETGLYYIVARWF